MVSSLALGLVFLSAGLCEAKVFVVGGQSGWKIPSSPDEYNSWAGEKRFKIGYILGKYVHRVINPFIDHEYNSHSIATPIQYWNFFFLSPLFWSLMCAVFKYPCNNDSVLEVNEDDYKKCNTQNPIKTYDSNGNTEVVLDRSGPFFFISGQDGHCVNGQKLEVVVLSPNHAPQISPPPAAVPASPPTPAPEANGSDGPPMGVAAVCGHLALLLVATLFN